MSDFQNITCTIGSNVLGILCLFCLLNSADIKSTSSCEQLTGPPKPPRVTPKCVAKPPAPKPPGHSDEYECMYEQEKYCYWHYYIYFEVFCCGNSQFIDDRIFLKRNASIFYPNFNRGI